MHEGFIYYAGGIHDGAAVRWFDRFDPQSGSWERLEDMPRNRDHFHAAIVDGVFYAIGGRDFDIDEPFGHVDAYDLATREWETLETTLPTPRGGFATAVVDDFIITIGGESSRTHGEVEAFDPHTGQWHILPDLPTPRHGIQAAVCGNTIYIAAGGTRPGGGGETDVHERLVLGTEPDDCTD